MSKVFSALAASVDGYITGRDPGPGRGLGDDGTPHPAAPLFVLSHRPAPQMAVRQRLITTGLADAV